MLLRLEAAKPQITGDYLETRSADVYTASAPPTGKWEPQATRLSLPGASLDKKINSGADSMRIIRFGTDPE